MAARRDERFNWFSTIWRPSASRMRSSMAPSGRKSRFRIRAADFGFAQGAFGGDSGGQGGTDRQIVREKLGHAHTGDVGAAQAQQAVSTALRRRSLWHWNRTGRWPLPAWPAGVPRCLAIGWRPSALRGTVRPACAVSPGRVASSRLENCAGGSGMGRLAARDAIDGPADAGQRAAWPTGLIPRR